MFYLPSYHFINNFLLLSTAAPQIDTGCFYTFVSHQIGKQGNIIKPVQKVLGKPVTERVRIDHFFVHTVFPCIIFQLLGDTSCGETLSVLVKENIAARSTLF